MKRILTLSLRMVLLLACLALPSSAVFAAPVRYLLDPSQSSVHFDAKATLHDFSGNSKSISGELEWDAATRQIGTGTVVRIPVMDLTTGMIKRDHSMRRMFEAKDFAQIVFKAQKVTPLDPGANGANGEAGAAGGAGAGGTKRYRMEGVLQIRQVEKPIAFDVIEKDAGGGGLEVEGDAQVSIDWFDLKPPVAFGVMRVLPDVQIHFKSVWKSAA